MKLFYKKHYRVHHGKNEFAKKEKRGKKKIKNHINGIENFSGIAKVRLYKFRGMDKTTFLLHLKEFPFRFNLRHDILYLLLLKICRNKTLKVHESLFLLKNQKNLLSRYSINSNFIHNKLDSKEKAFINCNLYI